MRTRDATLARTPANTPQRNATSMEVRFTFDANGNLRGETIPKLGENAEIGMRAQFSQLNAQNRARAEEQIMAASGFDGRGQLQIQGVPVDLTRPFGYRMAFQAEDYADFSVAGGMAVPDPPGGESVRGLYATASAPANETPFYCNASLREETYRLQFPANAPIIAIPANQRFTNAAGEYRVDWSREGQDVIVRHRLQQNAVRGRRRCASRRTTPHSARCIAKCGVASVAGAVRQAAGLGRLNRRWTLGRHNVALIAHYLSRAHWQPPFLAPAPTGFPHELPLPSFPCHHHPGRGLRRRRQRLGRRRDDLKTFTSGLKGLDGQFSQQVFDSRGKVKESTSGRVALSAPRLFRWEYVRPHEQLIVADGKKVWMYEPDLEQATVREQGKEEQNSPDDRADQPGAAEQQYDSVKRLRSATACSGCRCRRSARPKPASSMPRWASMPRAWPRWKSPTPSASGP